MEEIIQKVLTWLLTYANPIVGIATCFLLEFLKRNWIEKLVALTSEVKKILYPSMAIILSTLIAWIIQMLNPLLINMGLPNILPIIANVWIVGLSTGAAIALGYNYLTKTDPK